MELVFTLDFTKPELFVYNDNRVEYTDGVFSLVQGDTEYDSTSPSVISTQKVFAQEVTSLEVEETGDVTYILIVDGVHTYWDTTAWVSSDGTVSQSNSIEEINDNIASLSGFTSIQLLFFLNSMGADNAILEGARFRYTPVDTEQPVETVKVFLNVRDITNDVDDIEFTVRPSQRGIINYKDTTIVLSGSKKFKTNGGYIEIDLVDTENMIDTVYYIFNFGSIRLNKTVPTLEPVVNVLSLPDYGA